LTRGATVAQATTRAVTPAIAGITHILGFFLIVLAGAMLVPTFVATHEGAKSVAAAFALTSLGGAFVGGGFVFAMQGVPRQARAADMIVLAAFAWLLLPCLAAIPFLAAGATQSFIDAYFEAMSAFTTTGATVIPDLGSVPKAVLVWRALLAWLGGYATVVMAVTLLSGIGTAGDTAQRSHLPIGVEGPQLARLAHALRDFLAIYSVVTVLGFFLLWLDGMPTFLALCTALSTIATAGLVHGAPDSVDAASLFGEIVLILLMLFGATSFLTHWAAWRGRFRAYAGDIELRLLVVMFLLAFVVFLLGHIAEGGRAPQGRAWIGYLFDAASMVTTTGLWQGTAPLNPGLALAAMAFALIGGASMSTAGGIKLIRLALLVQQGRGEMRRLSHPRGVVRLRYKGRPLDAELLIGVWALFASYFALLAVATLVLCAFGSSLVPALAAAIAALSNTGPLYPLLPESAGAGYAALAPLAKLFLAVIMAAGRLEVLALLSLLSAAYWRR
jgi:trk system potassium uptake protein TrkH